jgi:predicted small integral membrane protein
MPAIGRRMSATGQRRRFSRHSREDSLAAVGPEVAAGLLAGLAAARMIAGRDHPERFRRGKAFGVIALALGALLWLMGFEVIGGEYFMMWSVF